VTTAEPPKLYVWPNEPVPARPVWCYTVDPVRDESDAFLVYRHAPGREVPDGLFLRELMTLDLASPDAIAAFIQRYGPLGPEWQDRQPLADAYGAAGLSWEQYTRATIESIQGLPGNSFYTPEYVSTLLRSAELEAQMTAAPDHQVARDSITFVTLDEFRIGARTMRDLGRAWRLYTGTMNLEELWDSWESHHPVPDSIEAAVGWMLVELSDLSPFAPLVARNEEDAQPPVSLTSALRLQVFNEIVKGSVALRCRNETCPYGVWYLPTTWNTGSRRYCCSECADMQTARERRRRVRDANRLAKQGLTREQIAANMGTNVDRVEGWLAAAARRRKGGK
jgi:hypothetical protein